MKIGIVFFSIFAIAVVALSRVFASWRALKVGLSAFPIIQGVAAVAILVFCIFFLGFFMYAGDKAKGNVKRPFRPYERMLEHLEAKRLARQAAEGKAKGAVKDAPKPGKE